VHLIDGAGEEVGLVAAEEPRPTASGPDEGSPRHWLSTLACACPVDVEGVGALLASCTPTRLGPLARHRRGVRERPALDGGENAHRLSAAEYCRKNALAAVAVLADRGGEVAGRVELHPRGHAELPVVSRTWALVWPYWLLPVEVQRRAGLTGHPGGRR